MEITVNNFYVVSAQAGYLARLVTEAPVTRIYFTTHRSGANSVPRVRTVVRGERASRSIVNRTTAFWSIWVVASLILAGLGIEPRLSKCGVPKLPNPEEIPDHLRHLSNCSIGLNGLYH